MPDTSLAIGLGVPPQAVPSFLRGNKPSRPASCPSISVSSAFGDGHGGRRLARRASEAGICLIAPQPARAQFGIDWGAIVAAIDSIGSAISNTIGPALRAINGALGTLNQLMNSIQAFFVNIVYPQAAIARAQGLVGAVGGLYAQSQAISTVNVSSATLTNPQQLEQLLLSRNPMNVPAVSGGYQTVYQTIPIPQNASPQTRDLIDMSDAAAQAAMKRAIAIDAIADTEMQAANQINNQLAQAAPGTAPMVEAEAAAWLV